MQIRIINKKKEWKNLLKSAGTDFEIIVYKYSPTCALSNYTDAVIDDWCKSLDKNKDQVLIKVDVVNSKPLSKLIEKELKVKHESPQLIWLNSYKKLKYLASHYDITVEGLNKHL